MFRSCLSALKMEFKLTIRLVMVNFLSLSMNFQANPKILMFQAGCGAEIFLNNVRVFGNCSCGIDVQLEMEDLIATEGACGMDDCQPYWISYQVLSVIAAAILGSTLIGKIIISLRSVLPQDKSSAIAMEIMFVSLFVFIPGKFGYRFIAGLKV